MVEIRRRPWSSGRNLTDEYDAHNSTLGQGCTTALLASGYRPPDVWHAYSGHEGELPIPSRIRLVRLQLVPFRPGTHLFLDLDHYNLWHTSSPPISKVRFLTTTWAPGATARRSSQLTSSAWQLHHYTDGVQNVARHGSLPCCHKRMEASRPFLLVGGSIPPISIVEH